MSGERALIQRAVRGDADAFSRLASAHRPSIVRTALHLTGDAARAEDVAQEVLLRMQRALPRFRGDAELGTWLYRVTLNLCRDHLRRVRRRGPSVELGDVPDDSLRVDTAPGHEVDRARARSAVRAAIERLPADQKEAVLLRFIDDLPYDEIARRTGSPAGTVASRIFRGLERLGRDLDARYLEVLK